MTKKTRTSEVKKTELNWQIIGMVVFVLFVAGIILLINYNNKASLSADDDLRKRFNLQLWGQLLTRPTTLPNRRGSRWAACCFSIPFSAGKKM